jgi:stress response protein SCP2
MVRWIFIQAGILIVGLILSKPAYALDVQGLPGSTWGNVSHDVDKLVGTGAMGYINQGIDWVELPGEITVNTFAEFRYRFRSENQEFYNAYSSAVGLEFKRSPFRLGMDYAWERLPSLHEQSNKVQYYLTWYYDWDLKRASPGGLNVQGFPGSTWGNISHDVDKLVGTGAMGYINQGIDWVRLPGEITFNTFAEFRYRFRSENKEFYNAYSKAVGLEFKKSPFRLGMDYVWERFPALGEQSDKVQYYLTWFYDWDLKHQ